MDATRQGLINVQSELEGVENQTKIASPIHHTRIPHQVPYTSP